MRRIAYKDNKLKFTLKTGLKTRVWREKKYIKEAENE